MNVPVVGKQGLFVTSVTDRLSHQHGKPHLHSPALAEMRVIAGPSNMVPISKVPAQTGWWNAPPRSIVVEGDNDNAVPIEAMQ